MSRIDVDAMLDELEPWQFEEWVEAIKLMSPRATKDGMMDPRKWLDTHGKHFTKPARRPAPSGDA